jgi:hypothetical protein
MTPVIELVGWAALALMSHGAISGPVETFNNHFAKRVDAGRSCFDRVSGTEGVYGGPHEFTMDLACNYRLKRKAVQGTVYEWSLERS